MDKLLIRGGKALRGEVEISGAKNAALPIMAATILSPGLNTLYNIPDLKDIKTMSTVLESMGGRVARADEDGALTINTEGVETVEAPYELVKTMRASVLTLGPLMARFGYARVSMPGGCAIGARPINLHLMGLEKMGAEITLSQGYVVAKAERLKGADINFDTVTVTGTENLMMAAVLANGVTRLENAAREPEVCDLAGVLIQMGAHITGVGTPLIEIEGVSELRPANYRIIPDRIETGTFLAFAGITGGDILIKNCEVTHIGSVIKKFMEAGLTISEEAGGLRVIGPHAGALKAAEVATSPYPGFPTDMQAQLMALMCVADGTSIIRETIFENRFMHAAELRRMGANIEVEDNLAIVKGVNKLLGAQVMATDLRASASLVVAALAAEGETIIDRIYHLDRGYEKIEYKLSKLGADIHRVSA
ncbi:MAG: UDP-N-acetylglucosamine 1-carboxyvinyltransferase [Nitrospirae bacterium]|nr:UDP-N-acetylglucosamine 1-carboxyvinyltransferase [Nitrospirota bacterium]MBF0533420.1 UDP-N-acetylglucosamine 1-carboxyvinyltransferase [Nitrospirota bacterium]MBF0616054.1 UDP-N-acetylglucosamine 1-carboxyvinyltransferase [Nitrospirota bacterium]